MLQQAAAAVVALLSLDLPALAFRVVAAVEVDLLAGRFFQRLTLAFPKQLPLALVAHPPANTQLALMVGLHFSTASHQ